MKSRLDPRPQAALALATRRGRGVHRALVELPEHGVDVAEGLHLRLGDRRRVGRQVLPQAPADELELDRLDEAAVDVAVRADAHRQQPVDERLRDAVGERAPRAVERAAHGRERRVALERLEQEPRLQPLRQERREPLELGEVLLPHHEHDAQQRVGRDRLGDLDEEAALLLLPAVAVQLVHRLGGEELLELVEHERPRPRLALRARALEVRGEREAGELVARRVGRERLERREDVQVRDRGGVEARRGVAADAGERQQRDSLVVERLRDGGVDERGLAGARLRVHEHDRVAEDQRDDLLDLAVAAEEARAVLGRPLERARPDVRRVRGASHGSGTPPDARAARARRSARRPSRGGP